MGQDENNKEQADRITTYKCAQGYQSLPKKSC